MHVTLAEVPDLVSVTTEPTSTITLTQDDVDTFARLSRDEQWIHTDVDRAGSSEFGGTIVHGYLLLSLLGGFWGEFLTVTDSTSGLNYGLDKVRFLRPVPVGSGIYATATFNAVKQLHPQGVRIYADTHIYIDGEPDSPVAVASTIVQFH